jgi:AcrR family transcriptional regulator
MIGIPTLDRKTRRHLATKAEVVAAAWEIAATEGVAGITIRDLAERVGLKAPSLYEYFPSKNAVYDAMFIDGWREFREVFASAPRRGDLRGVLLAVSEHLARFWVDHPARFSLLCQRPIPGFEPSPQAYAEATALLDDMAAEMASHGLTDPRAIDMFIAMVTGLVSQQIANEPAGNRWLRLHDWVVDMFLTSMIEKGIVTT